MEMCLLPFHFIVVIFNLLYISSFLQGGQAPSALSKQFWMFMFLLSVLLHHKKRNPKRLIVLACFCQSHCCDCVVNLDRTAAVKPSLCLILPHDEPLITSYNCYWDGWIAEVPGSQLYGTLIFQVVFLSLVLIRLKVLCTSGEELQAWARACAVLKSCQDFSCFPAGAFRLFKLCLGQNHANLLALAMF